MSETKKPVIVRLTDHTEVFGYGEPLPHGYTVSDPLVLEHAETEDAQCAFLTRFNRFSDVHEVSFSDTNILFVQPMSETAKLYYDKSLEVVRVEMDAKFESGLRSAICYMESALEAVKVEREEVEFALVPPSQVHPGSKRTH